jgi:hypothetical protein
MFMLAKTFVGEQHVQGLLDMYQLFETLGIKKGFSINRLNFFPNTLFDIVQNFCHLSFL